MIIKNTKAHFDPLCLIGSLLVIIFGGIVAAFSIISGEVSVVLISAFAIVILIATITHIFHHGFTPVAGIISIILMGFAIVILRGAFGHTGAFIDFYMENIFYLTIAVIGLDIMRIVVP